MPELPMCTSGTCRSSASTSGNIAWVQGEVGFDIYPRRLVKLPEGNSALVMIRRNTTARFSWSPFDFRWEFQTLRRFLHRDRSWRVEVYADAHEDPLDLPSQQPTFTAIY